MAYGYGIKQCRETFLILSSERSFEDRMVSAFSEIGVIQHVDVSKEHHKQIQEWRKKYLSITELSVDNVGTLMKIDKIKELKRLSVELVWLCVDIIEHNSRNTTKQDL